MWHVGARAVGRLRDGRPFLVRERRRSAGRAPAGGASTTAPRDAAFVASLPLDLAEPSSGCHPRSPQLGLELPWSRPRSSSICPRAASPSAVSLPMSSSRSRTSLRSSSSSRWAAFDSRSVRERLSFSREWSSCWHHVADVVDQLVARLVHGGEGSGGRLPACRRAAWRSRLEAASVARSWRQLLSRIFSLGVDAGQLFECANLLRYAQCVTLGTEGRPQRHGARAGANRATRGRVATAGTWAHLGSNQEQPGYEPGALTD